MIKEWNDSFFVAFVDKLPDKISARRAVRSVEIVKPLRVVKGKSVVMTSGEGYVFATRSLSGFNKFFRPVLFNVEFFRKFVVFVMVELVYLQSPFAFAQNAVKPEMIKHSEAHFLEIFDVFVCHIFSSCPLFGNTRFVGNRSSYKRRFIALYQYYCTCFRVLSQLKKARKARKAR